MGIKYLLILLPILLFSGDAIGQEIQTTQLGSMCQNLYVQCNRDNRRTFRSDDKFCNSNAFEDEALRENCLDKSRWDRERRDTLCERKFRQCWWIYEEEDSFYPFPMR